MKARDIMTRNPTCCSPDDSNEVMTPLATSCSPDDDVRDIERTMADRQVRRVPIVDDSGCCVGIVSQADIARAADGGGVSEQEIAPDRGAHLRAGHAQLRAGQAQLRRGTAARVNRDCDARLRRGGHHHSRSMLEA